MARHFRHIGCIIKTAAAVRISAAAVLAIAAVCLAFPRDNAAAWDEKAQLKIGALALESMSADQTQKMLPYRENLLEGISIALENSNRERDLSADIQLLMLIPHKREDLTRYFAFRLGQLSVVASDMALPFCSSTAPDDRKLLQQIESDIDADIESYRVYNTKASILTYPVLHLERVRTDTRKAESFIKTRYLATQGYAACKDDLLAPAFNNAVQTVASLWETILASEPAPGSLSPPIRVMYYTSQIKFGSERGYLEDVEAALRKLADEKRRIPLTAAFVGDAFFKLPRTSTVKALYELARTVDPQSAAVVDCLRLCKESPAEEAEEKNNNNDATRRRKLAGYLYGKDGKPPIYVYQHTSGLTIFTSKVKDVGSDYVCLNFEPVKKLTTKTRTVVRKIRNEPEVEEFDLEEIIRLYSREYGVHPALVKAVIKAESNFDPFAVSRCGARGLMQLMPTTAMDMQVSDCFDVEQNIGGGVQYLARMLELFNNDTKLALAAYNAGPGSVLKYGGVPPFRETRAFVPRVLDYYDQYKKQSSPVILKVAMNKKPAADYLPEIEEVIEEVQEQEEIVINNPPVPSHPSDTVVVILKNGNTMRGNSYEKTAAGIRLILGNGWVDIPDDHITKIS